MSQDEVVAALATDPQAGLSLEEARGRLERHGRNELTAERPVPGWRKFLAQFQDVLVILLLITSRRFARFPDVHAATAKRCPTASLRAGDDERAQRDRRQRKSARQTSRLIPDCATDAQPVGCINKKA